MARDTKDLLKKVRKIEIKTRGLSNHLFSGEYHSAFKGRGMAFNEVREYQLGDEIRTIDWNVTARFDHPYVKVFDEERELTVMILMDVSGSKNFGTLGQQKQEQATEICAVLAFSAIQNNDKVGVIFFSDKIEKFIPPKKGRSHILMIIRELIDFTPESKGTNVGAALKYFTSVIKKRCTAFLISDFITPAFEHELKIANKKHDIIALRLFDKHDEEFPDLGLIPIKDEETGQIAWVNTGDKQVRASYKAEALKRNAQTLDTFKRSGVESTAIGTHESYVKPLMTLFKKRESRK
ncbi:DUF58 domain-containing protein [Mucilaginibacter myungsuensis]|uniref:DUF58 domain-containing protein n=1 Tax=Mucilaginibacter myungsuensis TaxID=649104 RepID=A0A929L440_9SPHI|nr:DUF58 domain-containing protein [Mucilaginibacter myungsuensis]MBE9662866.1 DUF58 domain-containing protein [Mucilaginibacter myungsuensis]MDN3598286.1 DUF58 domain-containing protein [Mucilaginibacter myungsuensis]